SSSMQSSDRPTRNPMRCLAHFLCLGVFREGSSYPFDIIVAITTGRLMIGPSMPPTLLEVQDLAILVDTNTLTHSGPAVGMIFVINPSICRKRICGSCAAKEQHMRQYRTYSIAQAYAYTPSKDILQRLQTPMTAHRVSRFVSFVLGLALGTGVAVLLAQLSAWLSV